MEIKVIAHEAVWLLRRHHLPERDDKIGFGVTINVYDADITEMIIKNCQIGGKHSCVHDLSTTPPSPHI